MMQRRAGRQRVTLGAWLGSRLPVLATLLVCAFFSPMASAYGPVSVPEPLKPWQDWVLHDIGTHECPFSPQDYQFRTCAWPTALELDVRDDGASFSQRWRVYRAGYVALPGDARLWPQDVTVNGERVAVIRQDQRPLIHVNTGVIDVRGSFHWQEVPEAVSLPPSTALLGVSRNGVPVAFPNLDAEGRFWLKQNREAEVQPDQQETLQLRVYRRLVDEVPFVVETWIDAEVSGKPRELLLGPALLEGFVVQDFDAPLPARLEADGQLRAQLRAGQWRFRISSRQVDSVTQVQRKAAPVPWPEEEIWVFTPENSLRTVRVEGVDALDPRQTTLPQEWQHWQAYRLDGDDVLQLAVLRRGDPEPAPNQLALERNLWLDFDGGGWTAQDQLSGELNRRWRLQGSEELLLGEASVNGQPQVITRLRDDSRAGIEVRDARLALQASSRIEADGAPRHWSLSVSGWQEDFQHAYTRLHLPPGWRLLAVNGADSAEPTWLGNWTVWDVFLLLIAVAAVARVLGLGWGAVSLPAFGIVYPEAPWLLFMTLNVVAAIALVRLLDAGRMRNILHAYTRISTFLLVMAVLPFLVTQVRLALYPQLEMAHARISANDIADYRSDSMPDAAAEAPMMAEEMAMAPAPRMAKQAVQGIAALGGASPGSASLMKEIDPQQAAQTGPGLPRWRWQQSALNWSGPVAEDQRFDIWLLGPLENRVLALLRGLLMVALVLALLGVGRAQGRWRWNPGLLQPQAMAGLVLAVLSVSGLQPSSAQAMSTADAAGATGAPPQAMLDTLRERLWQQRDCTPACLGTERVQVVIDGNRLTLHMTVGALESVEMALPDSQGQWQPQSVVVDGVEGVAMRRDDGRFFMVVPAGVQRITLSGPLAKRDNFQLGFSTAVNNVTVQAPGWQVQGLEKGQLPGGALLFAPDVVEKKREETPTLTQEAAPAFARVERHLRLGLVWEVETRVLRVAPAEGAIRLQVPLLPGESVTTRDIDVRDGKADLVLKANQAQLSWISRLEISERLSLTAAGGALWSEFWQAEISPLWHVKSSGIDVLKRQGAGQWQPAWQPYPGETLVLDIERPAPVPGVTSTVDQVTLVSRPGARESLHSLDLHVRTSKGGEQRVSLPEGAQVTQVLLDGQPQASEENNRNVVLQVAPGAHDVSLTWREPAPLDARLVTPQVSLSGNEARNVDLAVEMPENRWVLFVGGPSIGPAVLFWGVALVLVAVALVLGRLPYSPLAGWQWVLLVLGFATGSWWGLATVAGWFFVMGWREKHGQNLSENAFNLMQIGLLLFTVLALVAFLVAIPRGLLGTPDMDITGNGSSMYSLHWYQDVMGQALPQAWVVSVPMWVYRALMLGWSLWVAVAMLRWLPWAWRSWSAGGYWRAAPARKPAPRPVASGAVAAPDAPGAAVTAAAGVTVPAAPESDNAAGGDAKP